MFNTLDFRKIIVGDGFLSDEEIRYLKSKLVLKPFKKGEILTNVDDVDPYIYFVEKGFLRTYYNINQKEITNNLIGPNGFGGCVKSFFLQIPSSATLQAIQKGVAYRISYEDLNYFVENYEHGYRLETSLLKNITVFYASRERELLTLSAVDRYERLISRFGDHVYDIPLKYVASYIGIEGPSLSRIRRKIIDDMKK